MSKAFTRESDDGPEVTATPTPRSPLPPGAKNYITPDGAERLRAELNRLRQQDRSSASELLKQQILRLQESLTSAVIVPPAAETDRVRFGATVTVRDRRGEESVYRIVGVDETDLDRNWVSWLSPIARALMNARVGERVRFKFPSGEEQLEVVRIVYE
jgi:transcription elongation factor GreB